MLDKRLIRRSFSKAASTYEANSEVQREVGQGLADLMEGTWRGSAPDIKVLDIGCGTGALLSSASVLWPAAALFGCDMAGPMLAEAKDRTRLNGKGQGNVASLLTADFDLLPYREAFFDICISNLAYQWAPKPATAFAEAARVLKPGGLLYFTTLGPSTLAELRTSYTRAARENGFSYTAAEFHPYKDEETLKAALEEAGFGAIRIETKPLKKVYADMWALLKRLKNIGAAGRATGGADTLAKGALLKRAADTYRLNFGSPHGKNGKGGGIVATYDVIYAYAIKAGL
jgi:malonyl-CoA O-methyltransferase